MHIKIMAALPCLTQTNTTKFSLFFALIWTIIKCSTHKWSKLLSHNNCPRNVNCLIYVIVCAAVQRTSTVTSGTGTTTSAWLAWNTMTWSILWPSAQQTRSCCCLPATTPPLKCGARHAWCASPRHPSAPLGLANCSPPCLAAEVLIWMVNPDLDPGGRNARGKSRGTRVRSRNWGFHSGLYENNKDTCILVWPFCRWGCRWEATKENGLFGTLYWWEIADAHENVGDGQ